MVSQRTTDDPAIDRIEVDNIQTIRLDEPAGVSRPGVSREQHIIDVDLFDEISAVPPSPTHDRLIENVESYDSSFCCIVCQESCPSSDALAPPCGHVCCRECWTRWAEVVSTKHNMRSGKTSCPYCRHECRTSDATGVEFEAAVILTPDETSQRLNDRYEDLKRRNAVLAARIPDLRQSVDIRQKNIATLRAQLDDIYTTLRLHNISLDDSP